MQYRRLGESGLKVSSVSLGSWLTFGSAVEQQIVTECVRTAFDAGVIFFDTADVYDRGGAERALGEAFKRLGLRREDYVLATKAFWPMSGNPNDRGLSRKHLTESLGKSLDRLGTDYVDLYQCHRFDPETPISEVVRSMDTFIRQGRVLYWGVSCWSAEQISECCEVADSLGAPRPVSNQPPYSLLTREIEKDVMPQSQESGLSQVVFSPLAQGMLTGKYNQGTVPEGSRAADPKRGQFLRPLMTEENHARVARFCELASELGVAPTTLAIAFTLASPNVASAIVGARKAEQLPDSLAGAELSLSPATLERLDAIFPPRENAARAQ